MSASSPGRRRLGGEGRRGDDTPGSSLCWLWVGHKGGPTCGQGRGGGGRGGGVGVHGRGGQGRLRHPKAGGVWCVWGGGGSGWDGAGHSGLLWGEGWWFGTAGWVWWVGERAPGSGGAAARARASELGRNGGVMVGWGPGVPGPVGGEEADVAVAVAVGGSDQGRGSAVAGLGRGSGFWRGWGTCTASSPAVVPPLPPSKRCGCALAACYSLCCLTTNRPLLRCTTLCRAPCRRDDPHDLLWHVAVLFRLAQGGR